MLSAPAVGQQTIGEDRGLLRLLGDRSNSKTLAVLGEESTTIRAEFYHTNQLFWINEAQLSKNHLDYPLNIVRETFPCEMFNIPGSMSDALHPFPAIH